MKITEVNMAVIFLAGDQVIHWEGTGAASKIFRYAGDGSGSAVLE
jgi:hypothetical protein